MKGNVYAVRSHHADGCFDRNRVDGAAYAFELLHGWFALKTKFTQDRGTQYRPVCAAINEKQDRNPGSVRCTRLGSPHGTHHAVVTDSPSSIKSHKSGPLWFWECT
jgi:hypothetical protein